MEVSILQQLRQMIAALVAGGTSGLLLDLLKAIHGHKTLFSVFTDLLALTFSGIWIFHVGQSTGAGMSLFFLCSAGAGVALYFLLIHEMVVHDIMTAKQYLRINERIAQIMRSTERKNTKNTENDKNVS